MGSAVRRLGITAEEFIHRLAGLTTLQELGAASEKHFETLGYNVFVAADLPSAVLNRPVDIFFHTFPPGWAELYVERDFAGVDPVIRHSHITLAPFEWREAAYDREREHGAREVMERAADFGMNYGFSFLVRQAGAPASIVSLASTDRPDLDAATKPHLHMVALYALMRAQVLRGKRGPQVPALSSREAEVLTWVAAGKTSSEIADILGLTERTVLAHAINATHKLGASSRTHAVAKAMALGLIRM